MPSPSTTIEIPRSVGRPEDTVKAIDPNDPDPTRAAERMGKVAEDLRKAAERIPPPPGVTSHPLNSG